MLQPFLEQIPLLGYYADSADTVQVPHFAAFDQGQQDLLTGISMQNKNNKNENIYQEPLQL